jgi:hypothetical protein
LRAEIPSFRLITTPVGKTAIFDLVGSGNAKIPFFVFLTPQGYPR